MIDQSIAAYNSAERIARYDADMEIMHPNRARMVQTSLDVLPFAAHDSFAALELGCGTGYFTGRFLERFPRARVVAVDGAESMVELAKERLGNLATRVNFHVLDFRRLFRIVPDVGTGRLVFSSYALHHLDVAEKREVIRRSYSFLEPGGWFVNADLVLAPSPELERRIQELRVEGIVRRAAGRDPRFADAATTRAFLNRLEAEDHDQPVTMEEDLHILREAGFGASTVFWLEHREAVFGARC